MLNSESDQNGISRHHTHRHSHGSQPSSRNHHRQTTHRSSSSKTLTHQSSQEALYAGKIKRSEQKIHSIKQEIVTAETTLQQLLNKLKEEEKQLIVQKENLENEKRIIDEERKKRHQERKEKEAREKEERAKLLEEQAKEKMRVEKEKILQQQEEEAEQMKKKIRNSKEEIIEEKNDVLDANCLEDLPSDLQSLLTSTNISDRMLSDFSVVLNILSFRTHLKFKHAAKKQKSHSSKRITENDIQDFISKGDITSRYNFGEQTGKGGFGTVYKAHEKGYSRHPVAIKKIKKPEKSWKNIYNELTVLKKLPHKNIVKLINVFQNDSSVIIVMEFLEGGTLSKALEQMVFGEREICYVATQILQGLKFLHKNNVIYRDLKCENIMLNLNGQVKLIDLGLCYDLNLGATASMVGTSYFMPPEMMKHALYGTEVDIWSFGITMLEIIGNGNPPFKKEDDPIAAMLQACLGFDVPQIMSSIPFTRPFVSFVSRCLEVEPNNRPSSSDLLRHPCLKNSQTVKVMRNQISKVFVRNVISNALPFM